MRTSAIFAPSDRRDLALFIEKHPLAHVVSASGDEIEATPLPLIAETDAAGGVVALIGHFACANRHVEMLRQTSRALCMFHGAHGYVSPSWMRDRTQAPTWNFETAHFVVDLTFAKHESETAKAIELLLDAMEGHAPTRWRSHELGERYDRLLRGVIGFRAKVIDTRVKFKLGQNERDDVFADIVAGLQRTGNASLAHAMVRANGQRQHLVNSTT